MRIFHFDWRQIFFPRTFYCLRFFFMYPGLNSSVACVTLLCTYILYFFPFSFFCVSLATGSDSSPNVTEQTAVRVRNMLLSVTGKRAKTVSLYVRVVSRCHLLKRETYRGRSIHSVLASCSLKIGKRELVNSSLTFPLWFRPRNERVAVAYVYASECIPVRESRSRVSCNERRK